MNESFIDIDNCKMRLMRGGSGPLVVYLHGAGGAGHGEQPFLQKLSQVAEVLVPEHPGYGASGEPAWLDNIHDLAYFYLDLFDRLDLRDIHLAGNSMGGWIAMEIAVRNATRLKSLTLFGAAGVRPVKGLNPGDVFLWSPEERVRNSFHDTKLVEKLLAMPAPSAEAVQANLKNMHTTARLGWEPRFFDPHLDKWLHRITVPTHVVWANDDKILPLGQAERIRSLIPGARLTVLEECGHLAHVEKPDRFVAAILDSVKRAA